MHFGRAVGGPCFKNTKKCCKSRMAEAYLLSSNTMLFSCQCYQSLTLMRTQLQSSYWPPSSDMECLGHDTTILKLWEIKNAIKIKNKITKCLGLKPNQVSEYQRHSYYPSDQLKQTWECTSCSAGLRPEATVHIILDTGWANRLFSQTMPLNSDGLLKVMHLPPPLFHFFLTARFSLLSSPSTALSSFHATFYLSISSHGHPL